MTPAGWTFDDLVIAGVAWLFGGAMLGVLVAALAGRRGHHRRGESAVGVAIFVWGLGNLVVAAMTGAYLRLDTVVLTLTPVRCEAGAEGAVAAHRLVFAVQRPGEPAHDIVAGPHPGECPPQLQPERLRLRRDALAATPRTLVPEPAPDGNPALIPVVWTVFGLFALLFGTAWLAHSPDGRPAPAPAVAPWRRSLGRLAGQLGGLLLLAALVLPFVLPGSGARAVQFGLRAAAAAMVCFVLANALLAGLRSRRLLVALSLLIAAAALLGLAEVLRPGA